jgi:hypothetical protein
MLRRITTSSISNLALALALALGLGACAGDSPDPVERNCTKSLYDFCITEHDCMSENCQAVGGAAQKICTVGCDATNRCPDLNGEPVACTDNVCQPATPVECQVVP